MNNILKKINSSPLLKNTAKLVSANIFMSLIPLVVTPIISRIYSPDKFAEWGIFSSLFTITFVILHFCYEHAIVRCKKEELANMTALNVLVSTFVILFMLVVFAIGEYAEVKFFVEFPQKNFLFAYFAITALLVIFQQTANREGKYNLMVIGSMTIGISQATLRILLGIFVIFSNGLIAGTIFAQLAALLFFTAALFKYYNKDFFRDITFKGIADVARKYKKFPIYDAPATLMAFAASNTPIIILSLYFSKPEIGCYSMIIHLLLMPITFIGSGMGKVYYQQISQNSNDDERKINELSLKVIKTTALISVMPTLFLVLGGDKLTAMFLGDQWVIADKMILCLSLWSIPTILTEPLRFIYRYRGKQNILLRFNALYFTASACSLLISCSIGLSIFVTLIIFTLSTTTVKTLLFCNILKQTGVRFSQIGAINKILWLICVALLVVRLYFIF